MRYLKLDMYIEYNQMLVPLSYHLDWNMDDVRRGFNNP